MAARPSLPNQPALPSRPCVFVLESNLRVLNYLKRAFSAVYDLCLFSEEQEFLRALEGPGRPALALLAWDGIAKSMAAFSNLRSIHPDLAVLVLATNAEMPDYEVFARLGASGVVLKPFVDDSLEVAIAKHLVVAKEETSEAKEVRLEGGQFFVRSSKRMREVEAQAQLVARSDIPVLILGESGTGKEIIAMYTHQMSRRAGRMFLKVNCAAMPADLLESELFGYEQGAFTGATKSKPGKFELCDGGTIFLDEIGEMPPALQAKLLHVLQDGTFSRLGGRGPTKTDVRVIAATNVNMKDAMARKTFREDLYYRLNGLSLMLPPLRERLDEIPTMTAHFMRKGAKKYDLQPLPVSPALLEALGKYNWPGNLRELENTINRYLILQDEKAVIAELNQMSGAVSSADKPQGHVEAGGLKKLVRGLKGEAESSVIADVLEETGWNRKAAANDLQISYKALLYKIKQYDLKSQDGIHAPGVMTQDNLIAASSQIDSAKDLSVQVSDAAAELDMLVIQYGERTIKGFAPRSRGLYEEPHFHVPPAQFLPVGANTMEPVPVDGVKAIFFVKTFEGKSHDDLRFHDHLPAPDCLWVRATFQDGEVIEGLIANNSTHVVHPGFYMSPIDPEGNNWLIYVLKNQLKDLQVLGVRPAPKNMPGLAVSKAENSAVRISQVTT